MFATAQEVNLLQAKDTDTPSLDDWGTCGGAAGRTSAGILIHDVLKQCLEIALPKWSDMLPQAEGPQDNCQRLRIRSQKKAWRARRVLQDESRRIRILLLIWLGTPIECLMSALQYRDSHGNGLLDIRFDAPGNPFFDCRRKLFLMVQSGKDGPLRHIFSYFPAERHSGILDELRGIGLSFAAQIWWCFLEYTLYPFKLARTCDHGVPEDQQQACRDDFFGLHRCCLDDGLSAKALDLFESAADMQANADWSRVLIACVWIHKFTNM
jgi:hypothetical protein